MVFTIPIPTENSVGTIRYQKGADCPLFPQKGGNGPLFKELCPPFEEKRGNGTKKGGTIPTEIPTFQQIGYQQNTDTKKAAGNTVITLYMKFRFRSYLVTDVGRILDAKGGCMNFCEA